MRQHPSFRDIGAIHADGRVFCSSIAVGDPSSAGEDLSARAWFREALASRDIVVRELEVGPVVRVPAVTWLAPIPGEGGEPAGVLFLTLQIAQLSHLETGVDLPPGATATVLDAKRTVVMRQPTSTDWLGRSAALEPISAMLGGDKGTGVARDLDGSTRVFGFARIQDRAHHLRAYVLVGIPRDLALALPKRRLIENGGAMGVAVLLTCLVTWIGLDRFVLRPVGALSHASREIAGGTLSARSGTPQGAFELQQLASTFDDMAQKLEQSVEQTTTALGSLRESRARLQSLSQALIESQEAERRHLARELHDEIGQALTAVTLNLDALRKSERRDEAGRCIEETSRLIKHLIEQVRDLSLDLRPSILDDLGLAAALRWYVARNAERSGVAIEFRAPSLEERLPPEIETACFRIAQEAVTNIVRHAHASRASVEIERTARELELKVSDDGAGFDVEQARDQARAGKSFGLVGMEERAALLGGSLEVESRRGRGTELRFRLPLRADRVLEAVA
jgi:signal transduction histidine kinase